MRLRSVALCLAALVIIGAGYWGWWSARAFEDQINNLEAFKIYLECLQEQRRQLGAYPDSLNDIGECFQYVDVLNGKDWWGNPLRYESRGASFILVSYGRDGDPEKIEPWSLREEGSDSLSTTCGDPNADQVASDLGFHRACTK